MSRPLSSIRWGDVRGRILAALGCAYVLLLFPPWQFAMPAVGLDQSWVEVIGYGAHRGWQWGRDVVFTYGPLGFLLPNPFESESFVFSIAANTVLTLAFAQGLVAILPRRAPWWSVALFLLVAFPAAKMGRAAYTFFGPLAALLYFQRLTDVRPWRPLILAAAAGVFAMVYVSSSVLSLAILVLLDLSRLTRRRWPIFVPVFVVAAAGAYLAAGQDGTHLARFVRGSIELISGYASAMSFVGNRLELAAFPPVSAAVLASILWSELTRLRRGGNRSDALLLVAALGIAWFVAFKTGFVRHDFHSIAAWQTLAMIATAYAAMRWHDPSSEYVRWPLISLSIAACAVSVFAAEQQVRIASVARYANVVLVQQPLLALENARHAVLEPRHWRQELLEQRMRALAGIRAAMPLPSVDGTVDVIPSIQSAVFAHGLSYRPRPVFQGYAAYTPWLSELNRAHYRSAAAAEYLFFRPEPLGDWYPMMDQGAAVNELLTFYDPVELEHDLLVLRRRAEPLKVATTNERKSTATFGQWISLESVDGLVMLSAAFSPNFLGRLAAFLFRPPILTLTVRLVNGSEQQFRIVEGMARSGFVLSPLIANPQNFAAAATGRWDAVEHLRVVAFQIDTLAESASRFYDRSFEYTSAVLRFDAGRRVDGTRLLSAIRREETVRTMVNLSTLKAPFVMALGARLFAHAPARLSLPSNSASELRVKFGLGSGAWSEGGATDGVCFRIAAVSQDGVRSQLFERCLDPLSRPEDRSEQTATIPVGLAVPGTLVFETDCRANCNWDASYWQDIDVEP